MILSVTFVPAAIALFLSGKVARKRVPPYMGQEGLRARTCRAMHNKALNVTLAVVIMVLSAC